MRTEKISSLEAKKSKKGESSTSTAVTRRALESRTLGPGCIYRDVRRTTYDDYDSLKGAQVSFAKRVGRCWGWLYGWAHAHEAVLTHVAHGAVLTHVVRVNAPSGTRGGTFISTTNHNSSIVYE